MTELADKLAAARAEVARLERIAATATCREAGCDMRHSGGRNAGCGDHCCCSVPVYVCTRCGNSDYGDNAEAAERRAECAEIAARSPCEHADCCKAKECLHPRNCLGGLPYRRTMTADELMHQFE